VLFVERALQLLRPGGVIGFILPNKFFQASYGQQLRALLSEQQAVWQWVDGGKSRHRGGIGPRMTRNRTKGAKRAFVPFAAFRMLRDPNVASAGNAGLTILLIPLGAIPNDLLSGLVEPLMGAFGLPCDIASSVPIPPAAYDHDRRQYVGHAILAALAALETPLEAERVLGIVDEDCYAPGLNFIFGQAAGPYAFIALPRLRQSFYGLPEDEPLFRERVLKEAVHELGHTYGLGHCLDRRCVMHFSNSLRDTDVKGASFCRRCQTRLRR
jgi:archaemetzincin